MATYISGGSSEWLVLQTIPIGANKPIPPIVRESQGWTYYELDII